MIKLVQARFHDDDETYIKFMELVEKEGLNISKFIKKLIKDYLEDLEKKEVAE